MSSVCVFVCRASPLIHVDGCTVAFAQVWTIRVLTSECGTFQAEDESYYLLRQFWGLARVKIGRKSFKQASCYLAFFVQTCTSN